MTIIRPIWRTPIACGVIRVSGLTRVRVCCARHEVAVIVQWLRRPGVDPARSDLPVMESDISTTWWERWTYRAADLVADCAPELLSIGGST